MYQNPVLFSAISNRESWLQTVQIVDDDTGDVISLLDDDGNSLYDIALEIIPAASRGHGGAGNFPLPYYDDCCAASISASLADYIRIVDTGTIQIQIPKSVIRSLSARTYHVFLTIDPTDEDDGRQLLIGRLPVLFGGRNT